MKLRLASEKILQVGIQGSVSLEQRGGKISTDMSKGSLSSRFRTKTLPVSDTQVSV